MDQSEDRDNDQLKYKVHSQTDCFHELKEKYGDLLNKHNDDFEKLSLKMHEFYESQKQTTDELIKKLDFCDDLKNAIKRHCPSWIFDIVPTGSTITGLGMKNSDLDITIHIPKAAPTFSSNGVIDKRKASLNILQIVRKICQNDEEMKKRVEQTIQFVPAQIPILKLISNDGIEVDLAVIVETFLSSLHNTFLTKHYVDMDTRFAPLCAIVKIWGEKTFVKNPKDGGFNSYALVLLVTHFLQCGTFPPILANLPAVYAEEQFFAISDTIFPRTVDFNKPLPKPLPEIAGNFYNVAELFLQFLHYYSKFDFRKNYISISRSEVIERATSNEKKVTDQRQKDVYIEDPFDEHNPGRTVRNMPYIRKIFRETIRKFVKDEKKQNWHFPTLDDLFQEISEETIVIGDDKDEVVEELTARVDDVDLDSELEDF